jgi:hypothetical protein
MSDVLSDSVHDDLEAYALGALDEYDDSRFASHLAACGQCRVGLAAYVPVVNALRQLPQPLPPPMPVLAGARSARPAWLAPTGYAAAAAMLLVIGGGLFKLLQPASDATLLTVAGMMADGPRQVAIVGPGVRGRMIVGRRARRTAVIVRGLADAPAGMAYHVWIEGRRDALVGTLQPARNNLQVLLVDGNQLADAHTVKIDLEHSADAVAPNGSVVASGVVQ